MAPCDVGKMTISDNLCYPLPLIIPLSPLAAIGSTFQEVLSKIPSVTPFWAQDLRKQARDAPMSEGTGVGWLLP